ncbi:pyridoxal phosphate-dependent transferase [Blastocladiella britannica]|nr:pyridoxal phosphate-dependent transferase [Blastocladiella britannica]
MAARRRRHLARVLTGHYHATQPSHDFASNDYLGLARTPPPMPPSVEDASTSPTLRHGSTGSRLLSGHSPAAAALEAKLAATHGSEAALLFNAGYAANLAVFSALPAPGDLVLLDEKVHASVWDGARMAVGRVTLRAGSSGATIAVRTFRHGDAADLTRVATAWRAEERAAGRGASVGEVLVGIESVYSMDGTVAPIAAMVDAARELGNTWLVVDEAHACGISGPGGAGKVSELGLEHAPEVLARVCTFGKAIGCHGAVVLSSAGMRDFMINYARPLIYSTMMGPTAVAAIDAAYTYLQDHSARLASQLASLIDIFRRAAAEHIPPLPLVASETHIQGILVPGNEAVVAAARELQRRGFYTLPIRAPTVAPGEERIRVCIHVYNTESAIRELVQAVGEVVFMGSQLLQANL